VVSWDLIIQYFSFHAQPKVTQNVIPRDFLVRNSLAEFSKKQKLNGGNQGIYGSSGNRCRVTQATRVMIGGND
jgi:hypothetical protein